MLRSCKPLGSVVSLSVDGMFRCPAVVALKAQFYVKMHRNESLFGVSRLQDQKGQQYHNSLKIFFSGTKWLIILEPGIHH